MPMPRRKPEYNPGATMQELIAAVCEYYGAPMDDRDEHKDHVSLHDVADHFHITVMKARKILITGNLYSTATSRKVQELIDEGKTGKEVQDITGLGRSSVNSYIPYEHIVYKLSEISIKAERQKQYRVRRRNAMRTEAEREARLWEEVIYLQGCLFTTLNGLDFTYQIRDEVMIINRKEETITRASILQIYSRVCECNGTNTGSKTIDIHGASYLLPIFRKMGLIEAMKA